VVPFDVMVWIHCGGFFNGSGGTQMYGPQYLLDKDIVLVTINYRLGTLGTVKRLNHLLYVQYTTCHIYCRDREGSVGIITRLWAT
jgi:carboxylesterase type B